MIGATHIKPTFDPCLGRKHVWKKGECSRCGIDRELWEQAVQT